MSKKATATAQVTGKVNATEYISKHGFPKVGTFTDQKVLQKFYKQLDTAKLEEWATKAGVEYKPCADSEPIHRMRVAMAILYLHFPKPESTKKTSTYSKYTMEDLVNLALDNNVPVEMCADEKIMRMRIIMALRAHSVLEAKA